MALPLRHCCKAIAMVQAWLGLKPDSALRALHRAPGQVWQPGQPCSSQRWNPEKETQGGQRILAGAERSQSTCTCLLPSPETSVLLVHRVYISPKHVADYKMQPMNTLYIYTFKKSLQNAYNTKLTMSADVKCTVCVALSTFTRVQPPPPSVLHFPCVNFAGSVHSLNWGRR